MAEEAARLLTRFGRRYAAAVRLATIVPICGIALFRAPPEHFAATAATVAVALVWTCGYAWWLRAGRGSLPVAFDVLVQLGLFAGVFWTDAVADTNTGWLRLLVTFACVTCQWHTTPLVGGVAALAAGGGAVAVLAAASAATDDPDPSLVTGTMWTVPAAALSRAVWTLVRRAAARADRMADEAARARARSLIAAAVRAEERELANSLHDTAATTLLMVGVGQVRSDADWLAPQARRDLDNLRTGSAWAPTHTGPQLGETVDPGHSDPASGEAVAAGLTDLAGMLRADLDVARLSVEFEAPARLPLPPGVAAAVAGAAREALVNVRRHSGTTRATVRLSGDGERLRLDIADEGKGFSVRDVPLTRHGVRESVRGRMTRVGGSADIVSAPGEGTLVRLEWPARHD
ncbi:sensor histidine kinase [Nonomuraea fuscirosea]|uniref:sensor histidine kinase n=1 Tax=Nonomuraea fuscirosea TaxID=1291556 RepID=UPI003439C692